MQFSAEDEDSDLKLWYAIGNFVGGTNVQDWTEMRGPSLLRPAVLPCGTPLYFLVRARNSQGLETIAQCELSTYDCTFPDGRVDAEFRCEITRFKISPISLIVSSKQLNVQN